MLAIALTLLLQTAQGPVFPAQTQMVTVTVSATDERTGAVVSDLKPDDLAVLEDGKRQDISHFEREAVPASVIILLDTSLSMRQLKPAVREAAGNLIHSLRPDDEVHVATFDTSYHILTDFTTDHLEAAKSLERMSDGANTALNSALYQATRLLEKRYEGELERRRILILLSDAEDTHNSFSYESVEEALRRSAVVCYVVHIQRASLADPPESALAERAARFAQSIVYETGGKLLSVPYPFKRKEIAGAFSDIATELGSQYHLGYASNADPAKGGWRSIAVALLSRSGVRLRFRRGYFVPPRK